MAKTGRIPPTSGNIGPSPGKTSKNLYPGGKSNLGGVEQGNRPASNPMRPVPQTSAEPEYPCNQSEFEKLGNSKGMRGK